MADTNSNNQPLWAVSALAVLLALGAGGMAMSQSGQITELTGEVENLTISIKKLQQQRSAPAPRGGGGGGDHAAAAAKAKAAKAGGGGGGGDLQTRIEAFIKKNELDADQVTALTEVVDASMAQLRDLGQQVKDGTLPADQRQAKMLEVLKERNDKITGLLGEDLGNKLINLLSMSSKGGQPAGGGGQKQPRPGSRLPK